MKSSTVYVIVRGEIHQGGTVKAVTRTKKHALKVKKELMKDVHFYPGIDYIEITKMTVVEDRE